MKNKIALAFISAVLLFSLISVASAAISVGLKKGDWIEYQVTYVGNPPPDHTVTSARMEVLDVQGNSIIVNITSTYSNGTFANWTLTLNLDTGQLGDDFIIPANLAAGDKFYDKNAGNITIETAEKLTYAGASRTFLSATNQNNTYVWDQATGVSVEGTSITQDYTMHSIVSATNIWQAQSEVSAIDPIIVYSLVIIAAIIIAAAVIILVMRRRKGSKS